MDRHHGFTLIELMIVVAIISVLATIALPAYHNYVARSQMTAALADISGGKSSFESKLLAKSTVTTDPAHVGLRSATTRCSSITLDSSSNGFIRCAVIGNPTVNGRTITLQRASATQRWTCTTNLADTSLAPSGCQ
jgi:type IV pilus assembly protein PilA